MPSKDLLQTAGLDDQIVQKLLKQTQEFPTIPTTNGHYIFVPTQCNQECSPSKNPVQADTQRNDVIASSTLTSVDKRFTFPQLRGVNRAGLEYSCVKGFGIFDGPSDDNSIQAIKQWNAQIIRLPINEDCWLGINGVKHEFGGEKYRSAVIDYVNRIRKNGLSVIIDLHWTGGAYSGPGPVECRDKEAKCQKPMPNAENSPKFWKSVAQVFKKDNNIIFELFNNPFPDKVIKDSAAAWKCWKNGRDACTGFGYEVIGMQELLDGIRKTGANNPIMISGIRSANDLSKWKEYVPNDSQKKIIASWHSFEENNCNTEGCWEKEIAPVSRDFPIVVGEIGEKGCKHTYIDKLMDWLDKKGISYLGWTWNTWDCSSGPSLIKDFDGTPTEFGKGLKHRLASSHSSSIAAPSETSTQSNAPPKSDHKQISENKTLKKQLKGVNRSGAEYSCVKNLGIFEGPVDDVSVQNMKKWNINVVRIPLNEDCWLGINGHTARFVGGNYRRAVINYVNLLRKNGLSVILDLHWSGGFYDGAGKGECVDSSAKCQKPMPDAKHAPNFWKSVAKQFSGDDNIIFDLYNEPFPDMIYQDKVTLWKCWRDGGNACPGFPYPAAGMQDLVHAVREVGATNPVMVGGINWSSDLSQWKKHVPKDPLKKLIASWHAYALNPCNNTHCWESMIGPIANEYPVIVGEMGETDCTHEYIDKLMEWLDKKRISYVGWTWNTWDCSLGPALIKNYDGTPTEFGKGLYNHLTGKTHAKISPGGVGNKLQTKQLRGVNRSGAEYSCVKNLGIFEGPVDDNSVKKMKTWNINVVRVPLNEDCWLGNNGHTAAYIGDNYIKAVSNYVDILRKNGLTVILDLHWTDGIYGGPGQGDCYDESAKCQKPMPDKANAPKFWESVAAKFKNDDGIIFDLFNEPFPDMVIHDKSAAWLCLRDGGSKCPGFNYEVAGMQDLMNAVRSTGAKNLVMVSGLTWSNDLSQWLQHIPNDSANNIAASWHSYDFNACNNKECWESQIAPLATKYPVIVGEIGQHGCTHNYIDSLIPWLDEKKINYVGWTWNTWDCSSGPSLILDYNGTPTEFGKGFKTHLQR